jgi:hypothetical protein
VGRRQARPAVRPVLREVELQHPVLGAAAVRALLSASTVIEIASASGTALAAVWAARGSASSSGSSSANRENNASTASVVDVIRSNWSGRSLSIEIAP